jgi:hypothetical protein
MKTLNMRRTSMEYAVRLYDADGYVIREALYQATKKEAKATLSAMLQETAEARGYGIDEMRD